MAVIFVDMMSAKTVKIGGLHCTGWLSSLRFYAPSCTHTHMGDFPERIFSDKRAHLEIDFHSAEKVSWFYDR